MFYYYNYMGTICCKAESNGNQLLSLDYSTQIKMTEMPKNNTSKIMGSAKVRSSFSNTIINLDDQKVITQPSPANGKLIVNNRTELNEFSDFKHTKCERSGYKNKLENKVLKFECKEDRKITKPESSILISRVPTNLKVTPSFFRIEKSGKLEGASLSASPDHWDILLRIDITLQMISISVPHYACSTL